MTINTKFENKFLYLDRQKTTVKAEIPPIPDRPNLPGSSNAVDKTEVTVIPNRSSSESSTTSSERWRQRAERFQNGCEYTNNFTRSMDLTLIPSNDVDTTTLVDINQPNETVELLAQSPRPIPLNTSTPHRSRSLNSIFNHSANNLPSPQTPQNLRHGRFAIFGKFEYYLCIKLLKISK